MKAKLKYAYLAVLALIIFWLGMLTAFQITRYRKMQRFGALSHPTRKFTRSWITEHPHLVLVADPIAPEFVNHQLCVKRGEDESYAVPRQAEETWLDVAVAPGTNYAFVLVQVTDINEDPRRVSRNPDRIVRVRLPQTDESLDSTEVTTILTMEELKSDEGSSWISKLLGVSPEGAKLLLERGFPTKLGNSGTHWTYRTVIYDIPSRSFENTQFGRDR